MLSASPRATKILVLSLMSLVVLYGGASWAVLNTVITPIRPEVMLGPQQLGVPDAEALVFESAEDRLRLHGWLVESVGDRAIILVHGLHSYAWDGQAQDVVRAYVDAGFHVLLFDLRAQGASDGDHLGLGWLERGDVRAAVGVLLNRGFASRTIGIHGTSYGAATALLATADIQEIGAVIADSAWADVRDVIPGEIRRSIGLPTAFGNALLPGLNILARWLYSVDMSRSAPERAIRDISPRPVLLIHGTEDSMIPFEHAQRLKAAGGPDVELWALSGRDHTEGVRLGPDLVQASPTRSAFLSKVTEFFREAL